MNTEENEAKVVEGEKQFINEDNLGSDLNASDIPIPESSLLKRLGSSILNYSGINTSFPKGGRSSLKRRSYEEAM